MGSMTRPYSEEGRRHKTRGEWSSVANQVEGNSRVDGKQGWFHNLFHGKIISAVVRRGK